jgi:hypothetical protein
MGESICLTCCRLSTGSFAQASSISLFADNQFDEAYNTTVIEGDLPHVRWGRIDYMNVTYITTKWAIWKHVVLFVPPHLSLTFSQCTCIGRCDQQRKHPPILARHSGPTKS